MPVKSSALKGSIELKSNNLAEKRHMGRNPLVTREIDWQP